MSTDERRKLTASWLNIVAAGIVSAGAIVPLAGAASGHRLGDAVTSALACLLIGILVHGLALLVVGGDGS